MTEAEWLAANSPHRVVEWFFNLHPASDRKSRLFAFACCCLLMRGISDWPRAKYLGIAGEFTEAKIDQTVLLDQIDPHDAYILGLSSPILHLLMRPPSLEHSALDHLLMLSCSDAPDDPTGRIVADPEELTRALFCAHAGVEWDGSGLHDSVHLLRDIFGNPFRPVAFAPEWRSSTAVALAEAIYAERAFDRLPILADALEEAGCDHPDVLSHCRGDGPHVRGCWVVDLVLGKT